MLINQNKLVPGIEGEEDAETHVGGRCLAKCCKFGIPIILVLDISKPVVAAQLANIPEQEVRLPDFKLFTCQTNKNSIELKFQTNASCQVGGVAAGPQPNSLEPLSPQTAGKYIG